MENFKNIVTKLLLTILLCWTVSAAVYHPFEPSPIEYGIIQQAALRNNSYNLVYGWRQYGDKLIYRDVMKKKYTFMGTTTTTIRYPPWGFRNETITCVLALDQSSGGTGGSVNITGGGIGLHYVSITFKSQFNRGLKYLVEVYAK